jgi:predicted Rossmann-fold nucleotide-binding protein
MERVRLRKATWTGKEVEEVEAAHDFSLSLSAHEHLHVVGLMREYVAGITQLAGLPSTPTVAIFGSARTTPDCPTYEAARETARLLAETGFGIITGGGLGIMEAANRGAREGRARSIGCPIHLERAEPPNRYVDVAIPFTYFAPRKATLLTSSFPAALVHWTNFLR